MPISASTTTTLRRIDLFPHPENTLPAWISGACQVFSRPAYWAASLQLNAMLDGDPRRMKATCLPATTRANFS